MRTVKIVLAVAALLITALSLWVSHRLTRDLEQEERNRIRIWADAMRSLTVADENTVHDREQKHARIG